MAWVATVLRSGGCYRPEHVERLASQLRKYGHELHCFSNVEVPNLIPLNHFWPGWWSKMELFRSGIEGDFLYLDLDSTVVGNLDELLAQKRLTLLRDFYRPKLLASGVMFIPENVRRPIWKLWMQDPSRWMKENRIQGDQGFLGKVVQSCNTWQDVLPGSVVSYKVHVRQTKRDSESGTGVVPDGAKIVCFHGKPRPWEVSELDVAPKHAE